MPSLRTRSARRRALEAARPHPDRARAGGGRGDRPFAARLASRGHAAAAAARTVFARCSSRPIAMSSRRRIDARFDAMLGPARWRRSSALVDAHLDPLLPAMKAHGVPALIRHLRGEIGAGGGGGRRPRRYPPLRQAAVHLVPAPTAGVRVGEAGEGEGVACRHRECGAGPPLTRFCTRVPELTSRRTLGTPLHCQNRAGTVALP